MDLATEVSQKLKVAGVPDPDGKSGKVPRTSSSLNAPPTKANFRWR
jgi:hypothetical protein